MAAYEWLARRLAEPDLPEHRRMLLDAVRILGGIQGLADAAHVSYECAKNWVRGRATISMEAVPLVVQACRRATGTPVVTCAGLRPDAVESIAALIKLAPTALRPFAGLPVRGSQKSDDLTAMV